MNSTSSPVREHLQFLVCSRLGKSVRYESPELVVCCSVVQHFLSMCEAFGSISMEKHMPTVLGLYGLRQESHCKYEAIMGYRVGLCLTFVTPLPKRQGTLSFGLLIFILHWFSSYCSFFPSPVSRRLHTLCDGSKLWRWTSPTWLSATAS